MNLTHHILHIMLLFGSILCVLPSNCMAFYKSSIEQDQTETTYKITVFKSTGEPQSNIFIKLQSGGKIYSADENGVITFKLKNNSYSRTANLYFNNEPDKSVKYLRLDEEENTLTFYIDSQEDLLDFKRNNKTVMVEAMIQQTNGEPIEGAIVSIQGTGRKTFTDEIGLFKIEADFTHPIVIRADGMTNRSMSIHQLLDSPNEDHILYMYPKDNYSIYSSVEKMPEFPGGMKAYQEYLRKNLEYPTKAQKDKIEGVVVVQFIVENDGSIFEPMVVRHLETSLDSAAWRAIKNMPKWIPGSDFGLNVRCKYSLPVVFKIPEPKPIIPRDSLQLSKNNIAILATDSLKADSLTLTNDSLQTDSLQLSSANKEFSTDSLKAMAAPKDSLQQDSVKTIKQEVTVKAKKRNIFVRFFRWLFGIKDKNKTKTDKSQVSVELSKDSVRLEVDSLDIHVDSLRAMQKRLKTQMDSNKSVTDSIKKTTISVDSIQVIKQ